MSKKSRIEALIRQYCEGKPTQFAKFLGVSPSTVSSWLSRDTCDYDLIFEKCKGLNAEWLLTGNGPMLTEGYDSITANECNILPAISNSKKGEELFLDIIKQQAEEIGRLKERVRTMEKEKRGYALVAEGSGHADVV
jgi:transcriptional regulator with XRE-family HTH domain